MSGTGLPIDPSFTTPTPAPAPTVAPAQTGFDPVLSPTNRSEMLNFSTLYRESMGLPPAPMVKPIASIEAASVQGLAASRVPISFPEPTGYTDHVYKRSPFGHSSDDSTMMQINLLRDAGAFGFSNTLGGALVNWAQMKTSLGFDNDPSYDPYKDPLIRNSPWKDRWEFFENARSRRETEWILQKLAQKSRGERAVETMGMGGDVAAFAGSITGDPLSYMPGVLGVRSTAALSRLSRDVGTGSDLLARTVARPIYGVLRDTVTNAGIQGGMAIASSAIARGLDPTQEIAAVSDIVALPSAIGAATGLITSASRRFSHTMDVLNGKIHGLKPGSLASDYNALRAAEEGVLRHTADFDNFLARNKLVDAGGAPVMAYHGAGEYFEAFDNSKLGSSTSAESARMGHWFTNSPESASNYAGWKYGFEEGRIPQVRPTYLRMENPLVVPMEKMDIDAYARHIAEAKAKGHDGVIFRHSKTDTFEARDNMIVFDPKTQIRGMHERWDVSGHGPDGKPRPGSVGAAAATAIGDREAQLAANRMVSAGIPLWGMNAVTRAAASGLLSFQNAIEDLVGSGGLIRVKNRGGRTASAVPVEIEVQVAWNKKLVDTLRGTQDDWREARTGTFVEQGDHQAAAFAAKSWLTDWWRDTGKYSFEAHRRRVGDALWNNGKDLVSDQHTALVEKSAARHRALYDDVAKQGMEVGVFKAAHERAVARSEFAQDAADKRQVAAKLEMQRLEKVKPPTDPVAKQAHYDAYDAAQIELHEADKGLIVAADHAEKTKKNLDRLLMYGPTSNFGESYRPRYPSAQKILAGADEFKKIIYDYIKGSGAGDEVAMDGANAVFEQWTSHKQVYTRADQDRAFRSHTEPGSAKGRTLDIPDRLIHKFMENDAEQLMRSHVQHMGSAIEMMRRFGSTGLEEVADEISGESVNKLSDAWRKAAGERIAATPVSKIKAIEDKFDTDLQALIEKRSADVQYERDLPETGPTNEMLLRRRINKIDDQFAIDHAKLERARYEDYGMAVTAEDAKAIDANYHATKSAIFKERDDALEDVMAMRDRIYGTYGSAADPHTWDQRTIRVAKQATNMTVLGLSGVSAVIDLIRPVMTEGLHATYGYGFKTLLSDVRGEILKLSNRELEIAGTGFELPLNLRAASLSDIGDMHMHRTSFERGMNKANSWYFVLNGLNSINQIDKQWASLNIQGLTNDALLAFVRDGKAMEGWQSARLAGVGIDRVMAERIGKLINEHGIDYGHIRMANTEAWGDELAQKTYAAALNQMVNRTVPTPGLGDTPNFMSKPVWSLMTQYKAFAVGQLIRTLYSGLQEGSPQFWSGAAYMVGGGILLNEIRSQLFFDRTTTNKPMAAIIADGVERSSILGWFSDANRAIETLTGHRAGVRPALVPGEKPHFDGPSRTAGTVAGPAAGQGVNALSVLYDFATGHPTHKTWADARQLIPGQNLPYMDPIMDRVVSDGSWYPKLDPEQKAASKERKARYKRYLSAEAERQGAK